MKTPASLAPLVDFGIIEEVLRPLMSGKEAQIYVVVAGGRECVAKVYKEASQRTFKHRSEYTEGRRSRNTRDQRAVSKRTRHGRKQDEAAWRNAEVDMIFRLRDAGVRVPEPINFVDGVLVMELVEDAHGNPAPRLGDLHFEAAEAEAIHQQLVREVVRMLCAGVVHGDLSEFNVLMGAQGPVLIDFPQAVDPAHNRNARKLLLRDVENLHRFVERYAPRRRHRRHGEEMWSLYEANRLDPDSELRGDYRDPESSADTTEVLALIDDVSREERSRRAAARGEEPETETQPAPRPMRAVVDFSKEPRPRTARSRDRRTSERPRAQDSRARPAEAKPAGQAAAEEGSRPPRKRRGRGRRKASASPGARSEQRPREQGRSTTGGRAASPSRTETSAASSGPGEGARSSGEPGAPKRSRRGSRSGRATGDGGESPRRRRRRSSRTQGARRPS